MRPLFSLLVACLTLALAACKKDPPAPQQCDCATDGRLSSGDQAKIFVRVTSGGGPVVLDSFQSTLTDAGTLLQQSDTPAVSDGYYLLITDDQRRLVSLCGSDILFSGYKDGQKVASATYVVRDNCYHIQLVSGDTEIEL